LVRIVSIAPYMPFPGIAHAGGEFYRRHAELAAESHEIVVIAPRGADNERAGDWRGESPYERLLVDPRAPKWALARVLHDLVVRNVPFADGRGFHQALMLDARVISALQRADRIELQWFRAIVLAPRLRRSFPGVPVVGVFHDVVSQGLARMLCTRGVGSRWRIRALAQLLLAIPLERRAMRELTTAVVLSEKDRHLLLRKGGTAEVVVVSPPLDDDDMPPGPQLERPGMPEVLFVGALERFENEDAARWLLREVWPLVRAVHPEARLTIAGARPSAALRRETESNPHVQLTGYVPSLSPYYERASVVVAPMRLGAGVKLKSVVAMLWGVPVVATPVGAEGVVGEDVFVAVEDHPAEFARAVVEAIECPAAVRESSARAYRWSHETYSTDRYRQALKRLYS
jgi:glycosyltransferase involved in cell wall biosynthesis